MRKEELLALKLNYEEDLTWLPPGGVRELTERKLAMVTASIAKAQERERLIARLEAETDSMVNPKD